MRALLLLLAVPAGALTPSGESLKDGKSVFEAHSGPVRAVAFSPGGLSLASASSDGTARLWDLRALRHRGGFSSKRGFSAVAFTPEGRYLIAGGDDGVIRLWDARTGVKRAELSSGKGAIWCLAVSPDGRRLAVGGEDGLVRLYDLRRTRPKLKRVLSGALGTVTSVAFSPDSRTVAAGGADWRVRLWDAASGKAGRVLGGHHDWVWSVAFSPAGILASGGNDGRIKLWNAATGRELAELKGRASRVLSVAFSRDGEYLAAGGYDVMMLWDARKRREVKAFTDHADRVRSVAFSADGKLLASGSEDSTVRLYSMDAARAELQVPRPLAPAKLIARASMSGRDILVSVSNTGQGPAYAVRVVLEGGEEHELGNIMPGRTAHKRLLGGTARRLRILEGNGFDAGPVPVATR